MVAVVLAVAAAAVVIVVVAAAARGGVAVVGVHVVAVTGGRSRCEMAKVDDNSLTQFKRSDQFRTFLHPAKWHE